MRSPPGTRTPRLPSAEDYLSCGESRCGAVPWRHAGGGIRAGPHGRGRPGADGPAGRQGARIRSSAAASGRFARGSAH